jgi:hypothetical protein
MTRTIQNRCPRTSRLWRERVRRFAEAAQAVAEAKWNERREWEARCEMAAEEALFGRYYYN